MRVPRRGVIIALAAALAALLLLGGAAATSASLGLRDVRQGALELERARDTLGPPGPGWTPARVSAAAALQERGARQIDAAARRLRDDPLLAAGGAVPGAGAGARTALDLAAAAEDAAAAMGEVIRIARGGLGAGSPSDAPSTRLLRLLAASQPELREARGHLARAEARLDRDLRLPLPPQVASQVRKARDSLHPARLQVEAALAAGRYLPSALGVDGTRTYLVLFANPWELRPSGGFYGVVATITLRGGLPAALQVTQEQDLAAPPDARVPVPAPLARRLSLPGGAMDLGDAGWDPDFPTSAALAERLYTAARGTRVDGVIALDPYALSALLAITGSVDVPPYGTFTAANVFSRINTIVNVDTSPTGGKPALASIADAVMRHVLASPASKWPALLGAGADAARERHLQLFLHDPDLASAARAAGFDGALTQPPRGADSLMVVDANVGGNKDDMLVSRSMTDRVAVTSAGLARHELVLTYRFPPGRTDPALRSGADPAYRDYVRVLLPRATTVQGFYETVGSGPRTGAIEDVSVEHGALAVGTFFRLPPGQSVSLHLFFATAVDARAGYRLLLRKQAGVPSANLQLVVSDARGVTRRSVTARRDAVLTAP